MANIAVVGAGLVGRLLALLLSQQDKHVVNQVSLFEKNKLLSPNSTGLIAAAMVAPIAESVSASEHVMKMGLRSLTLWPELLSCLAIEKSWWQLGTIVLAHPQDQSNLTHFKQRLKQQGDELVGQETSSEINAAKLARLEPELAGKFQQGLFLPLEGQVNNQQLYLQSDALIKDSGIHLFEHSPVEIKGNTVQQQDGRQQTFDWVIDCRGLGAKNQLLDSNALLRGVRGEVIRVNAPQVKLSRPVRIMHPRYPIYIVPKGNDQYVIGATEIESDSEQAITVRSALELLSAAYSVHSGFAEAEVIAIQTGLRPTLLDNEPSITVKNQLIQVNGLYRHGYLLVPYVLEQVLLLLSALDPPLSDRWQIFSSLNNTLDHRLMSVFNTGDKVCA
ncbi:FAD-dependent oxidoreductase [Thalassotalea piscium]